MIVFAPRLELVDVVDALQLPAALDLLGPGRLRQAEMLDPDRAPDSPLVDGNLSSGALENLLEEKRFVRPFTRRVLRVRARIDPHRPLVINRGLPLELAPEPQILIDCILGREVSPATRAPIMGGVGRVPQIVLEPVFIIGLTRFHRPSVV